MFKFLNKNTKLFSPANGILVDLESVPDPVFSQKMAGDGIAIDVTGDTFVAPADGFLNFIFETNHAFGMQLDNGVELLVHIGLDTVNLKGEGFERLIEPDTHVSAGTPVIRIDREKLISHGCNLISPVIVTNPDSLKSLKVEASGTPLKQGITPVITCKS